MSLLMRCAIGKYLYNRQDLPGKLIPRPWKPSSSSSSSLAFSLSWGGWGDTLSVHHLFLLDQRGIRLLAIFSTSPLKHRGLGSQSGRRFTVRRPSAAILPYINKTLGDVVYVDLPGQPTIVLNSIKAGFDLLDKRSDIYSDRPVSLTLKL